MTQTTLPLSLKLTVVGLGHVAKHGYIVGLGLPMDWNMLVDLEVFYICPKVL